MEAKFAYSVDIVWAFKVFRKADGQYCTVLYIYVLHNSLNNYIMLLIDLIGIVQRAYRWGYEY
jgi:hypothetical protein